MITSRNLLIVVLVVAAVSAVSYFMLFKPDDDIPIKKTNTDKVIDKDPVKQEEENPNTLSTRQDPPKTTFCEPSPYRFAKNNYAIMTIDDNIPYTFFAPYLAKLWPKMGYVPVFLTYCDREKYPSGSRLRFLLQKTIEFGGVVIDMPKFNGYVRGVPEMTSRYFASVLDFHPEAYLLLSDIDMIPMKKEFYDLRSNDDSQITLWNPFAADGAHGTCYIGMTTKLWRDVMGLNDEVVVRSEIEMHRAVNKQCEQDIANKPEREQWIYDQIMFERKLRKWSGDYKNGKVKQVDRRPYARLDRHQGQVFTYDPNRANNFVESHMARPIHHAPFEKVWDVLQKIASKIVDQKEMEVLNKFFADFMAVKESDSDADKKVWS